jgi:hypothetical protein
MASLFHSILRLAAALTADVLPSSRLLALRAALLVSAVLVSFGAVASVFWALHEVLYQFAGPGWGAVLTSVALWGFAVLLWFVAWRIPLRRRPRRRRREPVLFLPEQRLGEPPANPDLGLIVAATTLLRTVRERREARRPPS